MIPNLKHLTISVKLVLRIQIHRIRIRNRIRIKGFDEQKFEKIQLKNLSFF
jgi:hypothetical protein